MRIKGGRSHWKDWLPEKGMEGLVCVVFTITVFLCYINYAMCKYCYCILVKNNLNCNLVLLIPSFFQDI